MYVTECSTTEIYGDSLLHYRCYLTCFFYFIYAIWCRYFLIDKNGSSNLTDVLLSVGYSALNRRYCFLKSFVLCEFGLTRSTFYFMPAHKMPKMTVFQINEIKKIGSGNYSK